MLCHSERKKRFIFLLQILLFFKIKPGLVSVRSLTGNTSPLPNPPSPDHFSLLISSLMTDRSLSSPSSILPFFLPLFPQHMLICVRNWVRLGCSESSVKLVLWPGTLGTFNTVLNPSSQSAWQNMKQSHAIVSFGLSPKPQCWKL